MEKRTDFYDFIDKIQRQDKYIEYLEEENKALKITVDENNLLAKDYVELKEENKKLKESLDIATKCSSKEEDWIIRLSEENKKLKSDLWTVIDERDNAFKKIKQLEKELEEWKKNRDYYLLKYEELEEKVETLELWLDMKEKLNEEYRKQLGKLVMNNPS